MHLFRAKSHLLGGTLLIAGTTIGVGMLALPVATGPGGFLPAISIYLLCWFFMLCTGLLMLEVCAWLPPEANLITMARELLGRGGKNICWAVYLFLFVTVMIAHVVGGGAALNQLIGNRLSDAAAQILYVLIFSPVVYMGARFVDRLNLLLMLGVAVSYLLFIIFAAPHVKFELLKYADWNKAWIALPVLFAAFTYQVIIPTLMSYMERNVKKVRQAILIGTTIPLVVYLVWEFIILGVVPVHGPGGLIEADKLGHNAVMPLRQYVGSGALFGIGKYFAFFTLTTSYIALSLAFLDFLADGLKVEKKGLKKVLLCLAIFVPPTIIGLTNPHIFLVSLGYAGGISCAVLFGLYPPLMAWVGRYLRQPYSQGHPRLLPGGRGVLTLLILFVLFELGLELSLQFVK